MEDLRLIVGCVIGLEAGYPGLLVSWLTVDVMRHELDGASWM